VGFRFRLAPLLRHRERTEDHRALALARAVERREAVARRVATLSAEIREARGTLTGALLRGVAGVELRGLVAATEVLARRAARAREALGQADADVARAREALVEAARARRALERLSARQHEAYRTDLERRGHRELDDLASARALRLEAAR
jgi:flagellar FliJ protein